MASKLIEFSVEGIKGAYPDGKHRLRYDFNEIADAEEPAKCNLFQAIGTPRNMTAVQMRGLLYALLRPDQPIVTLKEAGSLLSADIEGVTEAVSQAMGWAAEPVEVEEETEESPEA